MPLETIYMIRQPFDLFCISVLLRISLPREMYILFLSYIRKNDTKKLLVENACSSILICLPSKPAVDICIPFLYRGTVCKHPGMLHCSSNLEIYIVFCQSQKTYLGKVLEVSLSIGISTHTVNNKYNFYTSLLMFVNSTATKILYVCMQIGVFLNV